MCARKRLKKHTYTHSQTHCKCMCTKWVCCYSEVAKEDEEQAYFFFKWGVETNSSIHSLPAFRFEGPPICDAALHTSVTAAGTASPLHSFQRERNLIHHFYSFYGDPNLLYDRGPHKSVCVCVLCKLQHCYITMFLSSF